VVAEGDLVVVVYVHDVKDAKDPRRAIHDVVRYVAFQGWQSGRTLGPGDADAMTHVRAPHSACRLTSA